MTVLSDSRRRTPLANKAKRRTRPGSKAAYGYIAPFFLVFAVFGLFAWYQRRREATGRDPLITTSLFSKRAYTSGLGVIVLFFGAFTGLMLTITLYLQLGLGFSAFHADRESI